MVGQLYKDGDSRKDSAYTIFYMGINGGAFVAPLVCGYLGENVDFKWGFLSAGVGMLLSLVIFYFTKNKYVVAPDGRQLGVKPNKSNDVKVSSGNGVSMQQLIILIVGIAVAVSGMYFILQVDLWGALIYGMTLVVPFVIITDKSLTKIEKDKLWVIIIIMIFVVFFWMCFEQAGASLTFFANEQTNRNVFGWNMPASYFQSFNAGFIVILAPIISFMWVKLAKKGFEPAAPYKQSLGLGFLALGFLFIALGSKNIPTAGASIIWLTGLYFLHTIGELFLSPIGLSMVNKLTPGRFTSLMMGIWFMAIATGNKLAGAMSSLYPEEQKISAVYAANNVTINGKAINWDSVTYTKTVDNSSAWILKLGKKNNKSEKLDSLISIETSVSIQPFAYDTIKAKRIIPKQLEQDEVKKMTAKGEQEPKFIYAINTDGKESYLLTNDLKGKENSVSLKVWNLKPEKPKIMGFVIDGLYTYFMIFVGFSGIAALILLVLCRRLQKMMHGVK